MPYRLKKNRESFTPMSGKFAGKTFKHGEDYESIPRGEERKFEKIKSQGAETRNQEKHETSALTPDSSPKEVDKK